MAVSNWSTTAGSNVTSQGPSGGTNVAEGMNPSDVNNAIRDMMAQIKNTPAGVTNAASTIPIRNAGNTEWMARTFAQARQDLEVVKGPLDFAWYGADTTAFNAAMAAVTDGAKISFAPGDYTLTVASLNFASKAVTLDFTAGGKINGAWENLYTGTKTVAKYGPMIPEGGSGFAFQTDIINDSVDAGPGAAKVNGYTLTQYFGGGTTRGGRHVIEATAILAAATAADNPDRNYVGGQFTSIGAVSDGGSFGNGLTIPDDLRGQIFGLSGLGILNPGATGFLNVTGGEFNVDVRAGATVKYKSGIQIANSSTDAVRGVTYDAALSISNQSSAVDWEHGILFSAANSYHPVGADGTLIGTVGAHSVTNGIDFESYTFTGAAFRSPGFSVGPTGIITLAAVNAAIEIGAPGSANTPFIDFHSGLAADYDARIIASGGDGTTGNGTLTFVAGGVVMPPNIIVSGNKVVGARGAAVADATDAATAITQLNTLLSRVRDHGLIAT